jgi:hypothetical protein
VLGELVDRAGLAQPGVPAPQAELGLDLSVLDASGRVAAASELLAHPGGAAHHPDAASMSGLVS